MSRFIELSLKRASVSLLIAIALVGAGVWATLNINQELTPDLEFPLVTVITSAPGSSAEIVAEQVTIPLETAVASVDGMRGLNTVSAENVSIMIAQFGFGADMRRAEQDIQSAVSGAQISDDASTPNVSRLNLNQTLPVIQMTLSGDLEIPELEQIARSQIEPELRSIDGVQDVTVIGGLERQLAIRFDPDELRSFGISVDQISGVLQANNVSIPSGNIEDDGASRPLRVDSRLRSIEQIENLVIGVQESEEQPPQPIRIADVATVEIEDFPAGSISRTNGLPSVGIAVTKTQQANTVEVSRAVNDAIEEIEPNLPGGAQVDTILDQRVFIEEAISGLSRDAMFGAIGAILAVWVLLLSFRSALIAGVSIPLSVMFAILVLYMQGYTLNILTLGGLAIAIGRVVDDSIVVLENIYRHIQEGDDLDQSIVKGAREIAVPVFGSTVTAVGVFAPLIFATGIAGVLFRPFALTVTIALIASTVIALTVVPVVAKLWIGRSQLGVKQEAERDSWLQRLYTPVLSWTLGHRLITLLLAGVLFVGSLGLLAIIPTTFLPEEGDPQFAISVSLPPGIGTNEDVIEKALEAEEVVAALPDIEMYNTSITFGGGDDVFSLGRAIGGGGTRGVDFFIEVADGADVPELRSMALEQLEALDDELVVSVSGGGDQSQNQLQLSVVGDDQDAVRETAADLLELIRDVPGLEDLSSAAAVSQTQIVVEVDAERALGAGLSAPEIAQSIRQLIVGETVTTAQLNDDSRPVSIVVTANAESLDSLEELQSVLVGPPDRAIPLTEVAEIREVTGPAQVTRENQRNAGIIQGQIRGRETGEVQSDIDERIDQLELPEGVSVEYGGALEQFQEGFETLIIGIVAAIVIVYVSMVIIMGSLVYPFIIMFTLPLTSIGALLALAVTGRPLSLAAMFGVLMLVGIVVANGIVLIDFINQLRDRGFALGNALLEGGRLRVRPVLMTAISTILALLPMAIGLTEGAEIASDLAIVVIGGLISATLLTLVVVPVIYSLIESLRYRLLGGEPPTPPSDPGNGAGPEPSPVPAPSAARAERVEWEAEPTPPTPRTPSGPTIKRPNVSAPARPPAPVPPRQSNPEPPLRRLKRLE